METIWQFSSILAFLLLANFFPPLARIILRDTFAAPLDLNIKWFDGRPVFGPHKTFRGILFSLSCNTFLFTVLFGYALSIAFCGTLLALTGDLLTSFIKRRFSLESGHIVFGLDQFLESFLPLLLFKRHFMLSWGMTLSLLVIFIMLAFGGSMLWAHLFYIPSARNSPRIIRTTARMREWRACHQPMARWHRLFNFENYIYYRIILAWLFKLTGLYSKGVANSINFCVFEIDYSFDTLPDPFDGYRILFLTDLHLDGIPQLADAIAEKIDTLEVDLCILGGDIRMELYGSIMSSLRKLKKIMPHIHASDGVYGVLGNHDCIEMVPDLEEAGVVMLVNDSWPIERDGQRIWVVGIDDPHFYRVHDLKLAFQNVQAGEFVLFVAHSPEAYREAERFGPELYLCGHTHGGQIRLPGKGPIFTHSKAPRFTAEGKWRYKKMNGYTSCGVGASGVPIRFNCQGEITLLTLRRNQNPDQ